MQEEWFSLSFSIKEGIGKISLIDKNKNHVISTRLLRELKNALKLCHHSKDVQVLVVTGSPECFSVGIDKNELASQNASEMADFLEFGWKVFNKFNEIRKPIIAQISGNAWDAGFEICLLADLAFATPSASFGFPGMKEKISPAFGGVTNLIDIAGFRYAKELLYTGRCINAEEALQKGIINAIIPENEINQHIVKVSKEIMHNSLDSIGFMKTTIGEMLDIKRRIRLSDEINSFSIRNAKNK